MLRNFSTKKTSPNLTSCLTFEELIDYSEGKLSYQQRNEIERHAANCPLCSDAIEGLIRHTDRRELKPIICSLQQDIHNKMSQFPIKKQMRKFYYAAAAVLFIALTSVLYYINHKPLDAVLFEKYFKPYPNVIPIVRGDVTADKLKIAMVEYESENYPEAQKLLNEILELEPENVTAHFYSGNTNLYVNNPEQAIIHFEIVVNLGESNFTELAEWYLGLAYLKNNDIKNARLILGKIASKHHAYRGQSLELLEQMEE